MLPNQDVRVRLMRSSKRTCTIFFNFRRLISKPPWKRRFKKRDPNKLADSKTHFTPPGIFLSSSAPQPSQSPFARSAGAKGACSFASASSRRTRAMPGVLWRRKRLLPPAMCPLHVAEERTNRLFALTRAFTATERRLISEQRQPDLYVSGIRADYCSSHDRKPR